MIDNGFLPAASRGPAAAFRYKFFCSEKPVFIKHLSLCTGAINCANPVR